MSRGGRLLRSGVGLMDSMVRSEQPPSYSVENAAQPASSGGKGGAVQPMPVAQPAPNVFYAPQGPAAISGFDNTGRITDPTLLAQQAILGRQPVQYQPLLTPDTYQNFYGNQQLPVSSNNSNLLVPDYRTLSDRYKQEYLIQNLIENQGGDSAGDVGAPAGSTSNGVGGYGSSGIVDSSGNFVGGVGQGISSGQQNLGLALMDYGQTAGGLVPLGGLANAIGTAMVDQQINAIDDSFGALSSAGNQPGVVSVSDAQGNVGTFSTPGSVALSDANTFGGIGTSIGIGDTGSTAVGGGGVADTGMVSVDGVSVSNNASIAAQDAANFGPSVGLGGTGGGGGYGVDSGGGAGPSVDAVGVDAFGGDGPSVDAVGIDAFGGSGPSVDSGGDGGGGGGKIICTAMNHAYGFGSFRNAIWIAYSDKHLTKAHEVGYHTLFLPLVDYGFKRGDGKLNMIVRKVLEWGTRHRSTDLRAEMRGTKRDTTGRVIRFIFEPLCYAVGKLKGY